MPGVGTCADPPGTMRPAPRGSNNWERLLPAKSSLNQAVPTRDSGSTARRFAELPAVRPNIVALARTIGLTSRTPGREPICS